MPMNLRRLVADLWALRAALRSVPWLFISAIHTENYATLSVEALVSFATLPLAVDALTATRVGVKAVGKVLFWTEAMLSCRDRLRAIRECWIGRKS